MSIKRPPLNNSGLNDVDHQKLVSELTKYADEGASDDDLIEFRNTFISQKKKSTSKSNSPTRNQNSESEMPTGSSATKDSDFGPGFKDGLPQLSREDQLRSELANVKVTAENQDEVSRKTDELSALVKTKNRDTYFKSEVELQPLRDRINAVDNDAINQGLIDEENDQQATDYLREGAKNIGNMAIGLINTVPKTINALSGNILDIPTITPYNKKVPFQKEKQELDENIKEIKAKNPDYSMSPEDYNTEVKRLKTKNLIEEQKSKNMAKVIGEIQGNFGVLDENEVEKINRLKIPEILKLNEVSEISKGISGRIQLLDQQAQPLKKIVEHDRNYILNSGRATQEEIDDWNEKSKTLNGYYNEYTSLLKQQQEADNSKMSAEDHVKQFALDYAPMSKLADDILGPIGGLFGGMAFLAGKGTEKVSEALNIPVVPGSLPSSLLDAGQTLLEDSNLRASSHPSYSVDNIVDHPIGWLGQTMGVLLPYMLTEGGGGIISNVAKGQAVRNAGFISSSMGKKAFEMDEEMKANPFTDYSNWQYSGALLGSGASEAFMLKAYGKILKGSKPSIEAIAKNPESKKIFEDGVRSLIKKTVPVGKEAFYKANMTAMDGAGIAAINTLTDNLILGKKTDFKDAVIGNMKEFYVLGLGGSLVHSTTKQISELKVNKAIKNNYIKLDNLNAELLRPDLSIEDRAVAVGKIQEVIKSNADILLKSREAVSNMTTPQFKRLMELGQEQFEIKKEAKRLKNNSNLSEELKNELIADQVQKFNKTEDERTAIFNDRNNALTVLPSKEQIRLKNTASKELMKEQNPDGTKNVTIEDNEITQRAIEIHKKELKEAETKMAEMPSEKAIEQPTDVEVAPSSSEKEVITDVKNDFTEKGEERFNISAKNKDGDTLGNLTVIKRNGSENYNVVGVDLTNSELKGKGIGLLMYKSMVEEARSKGIEVYSDKNSLTSDAQKVWDKLVSENLAIKLEDVKGNSEYTSKEFVPQYKTILKSDIINKNEAAPTADITIDGDVRPNADIVEQNRVPEQEVNQPEVVSESVDSKPSENDAPSKIKHGSFEYEYKDGEWIATDKNGNAKAVTQSVRKVVSGGKVKEKTVNNNLVPAKVYEKHAENFDFTSGKTAIEQDKINSVNTWEEDVAKYSENPAEIAETLLFSHTQDFLDGVDYRTKVIAEGIGKINGKSFINVSDKNNITMTLAKAYLNKKGANLDTLAQELSEKGIEITEQDIVDFMLDNPNGPAELVRRLRKDKIDPLKLAFTDLTGLPPKMKYLEKAVKQQREKINKYENSGSLDNMTDAELLSLEAERKQFNIQEYGERNETNGGGARGVETTDNTKREQEPGILRPRSSEIESESTEKSREQGGNEEVIEDKTSSISEDLSNAERDIKKIFDSQSDYYAAPEKNQFKEGQKEGQKSTKEIASKIAETLKIYTEKGVLSARQSSILTRRALGTNFNNPILVSRFLDYAYKVMRNADYKDMVQTALVSKKAIAKSLNSKSFPKSAITVDVVKDFLRLNPKNIEDINEYNAISKSISSNLKGVKVGKDGEISNEALEMSNNTIRNYVDEQLKIQENFVKEQLISDYEQFVSDGIIDPATMSLQEMKTIVEAVENGDKAFDEFQNDLKAEELAKRENAVRSIVDSQISALNDHLKEQRVILGNGTVESILTETEKSVISELQSIKTSNLDLKDLVKLNNVLNNITQNGDFSGSGEMAIISEYQKAKAQLIDKVEASGIKLGKINENFAGALSLNLLPEFISKSTKVAAEIQNHLGINELQNSNARVKIAQGRITEEYTNLKKSLGKDLDSAENRYRRGIYSRVIQHLGGTEIDQLSEFVRVKDWVKQTGERLSQLSESDFPKEVKEGQLVNQVFNELLEGSNNVFEVTAKLKSIAPGNIKLVDFWINKHDEISERLFENSEIYSNKVLDKVANYTATSVKGVGGKSFIEAAIERDIFEQNFFNKKIDSKEAGAKNNRTKAQNLPKNAVLDLDFDNVQSKKFHEANYDVETSKTISKLRRAFSDPEVAKALGGVSNLGILENAVRSAVLVQKNKLPVPKKIERMAVKTLSILQAKGARVALGSVTQLPKQYISVAWNTIANLGIESPLFFKALSVGNNLELFDTVNVGQRGGTKAGYNKEVDFSEIEKIDFGNTVEKGMSKIGEVGAKVSDGIMKSLEVSDVAVARTSWLAYYMSNLKSQGIDINTIDWKNEHLNINKEASAYAEQQVSRNQNPNDASSMAEFYHDRGWGQVVKNVVMPFSTFSANQRGRMTNDLQKIVYGGEKGEAFKSLAATLVEQSVFNGIKIKLLSSGATLGANALLGAFGYTDDDNKIVDQHQFQKWATSVFSDFFFSGMGSLPQEGLQHLTNQVTNIASGKQYFYNYDPTKYGQPEFIKYMGIYGTPLAAANELYDDAQYIDGVHGKFAGKDKEDIPTEMTAREKNISRMIFMIDALNLVGVSDAFITQMNRKVKRKFEDQITEDYGGEITITVPTKPKDQKNDIESEFLEKRKEFKKNKDFKSSAYRENEKKYQEYKASEREKEKARKEKTRN